MIRKVKKYFLDVKKTSSYFYSVLKDGNFLSSELMRVINFDKGIFYTILPEEANFERVYEFPYGGIIPTKDVGYDPVYLDSLKKEFVPLAIHTMEDELVSFIYKFISKNKKGACVFEDVIYSINDSKSKIFNEHGLVYKDELYYLIDSKKNKLEVILKMIREANALWRFLCVLIERFPNDILDKKLTLKNMEEICENTKIIVVGAYDGEGYVFWEKE